MGAVRLEVSSHSFKPRVIHQTILVVFKKMSNIDPEYPRSWNSVEAGGQANQGSVGPLSISDEESASASMSRL